MEFENIILTVPSHLIRDLENVLEVEKLWNGIMKGVADLAVIPQKFIRKERFVADVQISLGWMHSGYPIMMHSSIGAELFNPQDARTKGLWGEIHELGHNQQRSPWEFPPHTTEATCNLWSVYVHEEVLGVNREKASRNITSAKRKHYIEKYVKGGKNLSDWNVWTALETYLQMNGMDDM
ncbi:PREDICTED: TRPM8 channel-associated factor homolog [Poecilia mexicana]|nr:PREDICTED: TRPM8 channel-associated factor homolog [Poecilia mexicana]